MKKFIFLAPYLLTLILLISACSNNTKQNTTIINNKTTEKSTLVNQEGTFEVDTLNSNVEWLGEKPTGTHYGDIKIKKGFVSTDKKGNILKGKFVLDMNTINCTDLEGKKKKSIEEHLKDPDFFDTSKYPTASFVIEKVEQNTIMGILTIKGISHPIKFDYAKVSPLTYNAEIIVDRTLFDIKYKSKSIFPELGDHFINDEFKITLNPISFK